MDIWILGSKRRDGKYKVKIRFQGSANAFGGFDYGKEFTKLKTVEQVWELLNHPTLNAAWNLAQFYQLEQNEA